MLKASAITVSLAIATSAAAAEVSKQSVLQRVEVPGGKSLSVMALLEFRPGALISLHTHPGPELGTVVQGHLHVSVNGQPDHM